MSLETKVRPTITVGDLQIIGACIGNEIAVRITDGKTNPVFVAHLMELKKYVESFNPASKMSSAAMLAEMLGNANDTTGEQTAIENYAIAQQSPLDTELSDGQKYDLLMQKKEHQRTDAENKWLLNTGTFVRMQREMPKQVSAGDL